MGDVNGTVTVFARKIAIVGLCFVCWAAGGCRPPEKTWEEEHAHLPEMRLLARRIGEGMRADEVRRVLGEPADRTKSRRTPSRGTWTYEAKDGILFLSIVEGRVADISLVSLRRD